ncbi:hypothetical protein O181_017717 [Austropuccinia psidii MF-1]|uniref:Proteasome maturation factor UMP1 n=1 Tax=Austropuccinia psidii MF-1 TaxID=1389203 RepID=A0A9Q3GSU1_9BASI|nr:hypothetical protein [Austropuccinia psidii MF-1]
MASYVVVPPNHATPSTIKTDVHQNELATGSALVAPHHPLKNRIANWQQTQDKFKFTLQRDIYGSAFPLRQMMERDLIKRDSVRLPGQPKPSNLHLDILMGRDEMIAEEDAFLPHPYVAGECSIDNKADFRSQMERELKI